MGMSKIKGRKDNYFTQNGHAGAIERSERERDEMGEYRRINTDFDWFCVMCCVELKVTFYKK